MHGAQNVAKNQVAETCQECAEVVRPCPECLQCPTCCRCSPGEG